MSDVVGCWCLSMGPFVDRAEVSAGRSPETLANNLPRSGERGYEICSHGRQTVGRGLPNHPRPDTLVSEATGHFKSAAAYQPAYAGRSPETLAGTLGAIASTHCRGGAANLRLAPANDLSSSHGVLSEPAN